MGQRAPIFAGHSSKSPTRLGLWAVGFSPGARLVIRSLAWTRVHRRWVMNVCN